MHRIAILASLALALAFVPGLPAETAPGGKLPELKVPEVADPPKIDGRLDDSAWKEAAVATDFRLANGDVPKGRARLLVAQDAKNLYVAVECFEDEAALKALRTRIAEHDGDEIWTDDVVELFLDPMNRRQAYYEIIVSARGTTWDAWHAVPNHPDKSWEPRYAAAVKVGKTSWAAEFALPWSMFDRTANSESAWAFNVLHFRPAAQELLFWSPVFSRTAHTPEKFGTLTGIAHATRGGKT
jgi:hypothetical protein